MWARTISSLLSLAVHHDGIGSRVQGEWNLFDQILVNSELVNPGKEGVTPYLPHGREQNYYGRVFSKTFMVSRTENMRGQSTGHSPAGLSSMDIPTIIRHIL